MNLDGGNTREFFIPTPSGASRYGTRSDAIAWLTGLYGEHPHEVGVEDGTEDDFGDLVYADLPFAILGEPVDPQDRRLNTLEDRICGFTYLTWDRVLDIAREVLV